MGVSTTLRELYYDHLEEMYQKHRFGLGCYKVGKGGWLGVKLEMTLGGVVRVKVEMGTGGRGRALGQRWRWGLGQGWAGSKGADGDWVLASCFLRSCENGRWDPGRLGGPEYPNQLDYGGLPRLKTLHGARRKRIDESEGREIRTPNLLIWSQTRCCCAIPPCQNVAIHEGCKTVAMLQQQAHTCPYANQ